MPRADSCMLLLVMGCAHRQKRPCRVLLHAMPLHTEGHAPNSRLRNVLAHVLLGKLMEFRASRKEGSLASWSNPGIWIAGTA